METLMMCFLFIALLFAEENEPIIKDINPIEILGKTANKAECKFILKNDLTVDLIYSDSDTTYLVYANKAYNIGNLPFLLFDEEIEKLTK
jgi:hypothetical protein